MLVAGASRAVVPVPPPPELLREAPPAAGKAAAVGAAACPAASPAVLAAESDELAAPLKLDAEQPARNMPPPSRTLPIIRPAVAPCLVRPDRSGRRVKLRVFSMPV
jgi:hypothetical protein